MHTHAQWCSVLLLFLTGTRMSTIAQLFWTARARDLAHSRSHFWCVHVGCFVDINLTHVHETARWRTDGTLLIDVILKNSDAMVWFGCVAIIVRAVDLQQHYIITHMNAIFLYWDLFIRLCMFVCGFVSVRVRLSHFMLRVVVLTCVWK